MATEIVKAREKDVPVIEAILSEAAAWLEETGKSMWREDQVKWERLSKDFAIGEFMIALSDGNPAACMALTGHAMPWWEGVAYGEALYIHKLAVRRPFAGSGLSAALIEHAKKECMERGIGALKLDCAADRPKLRAVYERMGFGCIGESVLFGKYTVAFYAVEVHDTDYLYHYYEKGTPPFRTLTTLTHDEARTVLLKRSFSDLPENFIDGFIRKRFAFDTMLRDKFISIGGKPIRSAPVYFTLGANAGMTTWFNEPVFIKIPAADFDPDRVSYTYGDSFAALNPELDTGEDWWGNVYRHNDILKLIEKYGWPEDPPYHMGKRVFPKDRHINRCLKFVEAHVWDDSVLDKYR